MMAEKKEIEAFLKGIQEKDPESVMVVYTTRHGNVVSLEMVGFAGHHIPILSAYTRMRLDRLTAAYFNRNADSAPMAPMMHGPKSNATSIIPPPRPLPNETDKAVRRVLRQARKKPKKKSK
jgi:hypothetical protein